MHNNPLKFITSLSRPHGNIPRSTLLWDNPDMHRLAYAIMMTANACRKIDIRSSTTTMPIRLSLTTMLMTHVSQYRYTMLQPQYKLCSGEIWIIFNWPAHERHFAVIVPGNQDIDSSQEIAEVDALLLQPWLTAPPPGDVVVFTVLYNINNFQSTTFQP